MPPSARPGERGVEFGDAHPAPPLATGPAPVVRLQPLSVVMGLLRPTEVTPITHQ